MNRIPFPENNSPNHTGLFNWEKLHYLVQLPDYSYLFYSFIPDRSFYFPLFISDGDSGVSFQMIRRLHIELGIPVEM
jgi:hypothetical protein